MKIVIASSGLGHVARGIEAWAHDLSRALLARGLDVTLCKGGGQAQAAHEHILPCWQRSAASTRRLLNLLPRRLTWRVGLGSAYGLEQSSFALCLVDYLRRRQADILHVQDPQVALIAQYAHRLGLIPTRTILAHGTEEPPAFLRKITYLQHLAPWHLQAARHAGAWKPTWTAIPNFIDTATFHPGRADDLRAELGIPADARVVLSVAAIKRKHKRIDYLLSEFAKIRQPSYLIIAGGCEAETESLVQEGRQLLGDRVRFLVGFPRQRMAELYRAADLFVLGSLFEMMPIALLEATASGLPCLVNRHPIFQWISGPGAQAIEMEAPGALAQAIDCIDVHAMAEGGRRHCERHFSTDRVVDEVFRYYGFVLQNHRAALRRAG
jgi:glycosyltransferase involved in cell wall biosynthesis